MSPAYWIGVDGGATKTGAVLIDQGGAELARATSGPTNLHAVGAAPAQKALCAAIETLPSRAGVPVAAVRGIGLGVAGAGRRGDRERIRQMVRRVTLWERITVTHDAEAALVGGTGRRRGAVLIAGTGAMAYAIDAAGHTRRADGWGPLLGDAGSGYWIGREGLRTAARALDRGPPLSVLEERILQALQVRDAESLIERVYSPALGPSRVAELAPVVARAAAGGDETAARILVQAGQALARSLAAVVAGLGMQDQAFEVVLSGGVLCGVGPVRETVVAALPGIAPHARAIAPRHDAAYGAALLARDAEG
jgi:N-acetylglucosamine kinase-like BadF-type ATPase